MPSIRQKSTKSGQPYYEIRCRVSRERPELTTRWYSPEGWSQRAIDRELQRQAAEFERQCQAGEVLSRAEQQAIDAVAAKEAAAIRTLRQYGELVFMPTKGVT